jgi:hypothetical protein
MLRLIGPAVARPKTNAPGGSGRRRRAAAQAQRGVTRTAGRERRGQRGARAPARAAWGAAQNSMGSLVKPCTNSVWAR